MDPHTHCHKCAHPWTSHGPEGCTFHQHGLICYCPIINTDTPERPGLRIEYPSGWIKCDPSVPRQLLEAKNEVKRLDAENNERFSRETEYQNRIRTLEARVLELEQVIRDIRYYAERKL